LSWPTLRTFKDLIYLRTYLLTCMHHFNSHFPGQCGLASCPHDSQSPITEHRHRTGWNSTYRRGASGLTTIPRGFEAEVFTGHIQQCQSTEGI